MNVASAGQPAQPSPHATLVQFCDGVDGLSCSDIEKELLNLQLKSGVKLEAPPEEENKAMQQSFTEGTVPNELQEFCRTGALFDPQGRIGNIFGNIHKKGQDAHDVYTEDNTLDGKREYRVKWQKLFLGAFVIGTEHNTAQQRIDATRGGI